MLRVICIDNSDRGQGKAIELIEGGNYTVVQELTHPLYRNRGYVLLEVKSPLYRGGFIADRFIPLSEIDETQMERNYDKIKVLL